MRNLGNIFALICLIASTALIWNVSGLGYVYNWSVNKTFGLTVLLGFVTVFSLWRFKDTRILCQKLFKKRGIKKIKTSSQCKIIFVEMDYDRNNIKIDVK